MSAEDLVTLSIIRRYLDFKVSLDDLSASSALMSDITADAPAPQVGEVLHEVSAELLTEGATPVPSDEEALKSLRQVSEDTVRTVRSLQQSILGRQQQEELQEEKLLYEEVKLTVTCSSAVRFSCLAKGLVCVRSVPEKLFSRLASLISRERLRQKPGRLTWPEPQTTAS